MKKAPIIGITSSYVRQTLNSEGVYVHHDYHRAVLKAGGIPVILPSVPPNTIPYYLDLCDGFILSGGEDVDPMYYGQAPHAKMGSVFAERDEFELELTALLLKKKKPILAICRGLQVLNVALGGTLWQDVPSQVSSHIQHAQTYHRSLSIHEVTLVPHSQLAKMMEADKVNVNSLHHQAIDALGKGLSVVGHSPDHLIEAVEMDGDVFVIGVQWHPESMVPGSTEMNRLFSSFICAAAHGNKDNERGA
ncbi:gamma-glutamyl-gamma-aminobutyrate hydrolase family protein [Domibacillus indicus]|uniref:gamma-glutamyl-gamma-aminobutyrate hydrolase family protein n=1 Tax=Domibacillus TaxID=1433999 RepID=UPI001F59F946|nr:MULTISPECIES: gamma-glutamyl-gamma-aminobutyrate hydrolase family protein [Domibacillus]MCI2253375.1 gamma-glutamyl-gamma-aminobutyrate hydrolase family protein [Domibacillus sp. PGB-M46]MCM3787833.1 gamma-glutamyl-gamma-aminobutyrate hydrolase family protein [Domibacillus indicus]